MIKEQAYEKIERVEYKPFQTRRDMVISPDSCHHGVVNYPVYLKSEDFQYTHHVCAYCGVVDPDSIDI